MPMIAQQPEKNCGNCGKRNSEKCPYYPQFIDAYSNGYCRMWNS
jgi:hypothetical protein